MSLYQRRMFFYVSLARYLIHLCDYVSRVDLMHLIEEAIDRARTAMGDSGIGSVYEDYRSAYATRRKHC